ncbi:MAG: bifunctional hydroxymethylpyrimidine kinase/phosphomethylpyrimidine kinase, partial [Deltaproteobacteria bacterium]
ELKLAAGAIKEFSPGLVLVKGGHLNGKAVDVLYDGKGFKTFEAERIKRGLHGTGCIFSSAIASCLANGMNIIDSIKKAKLYTAGLIRQESWC